MGGKDNIHLICLFNQRLLADSEKHGVLQGSTYDRQGTLHTVDEELLELGLTAH